MCSTAPVGDDTKPASSTAGCVIPYEVGAWVYAFGVAIKAAIWLNPNATGAEADIINKAMEQHDRLASYVCAGSIAPPSASADNCPATPVGDDTKPAPSTAGCVIPYEVGCWLVTYSKAMVAVISNNANANGVVKQSVEQHARLVSFVETSSIAPPSAAADNCTEDIHTAGAATSAWLLMCSECCSVMTALLSSNSVEIGCDLLDHILALHSHLDAHLASIYGHSSSCVSSGGIHAAHDNTQDNSDSAGGSHAADAAGCNISKAYHSLHRDTSLGCCGCNSQCMPTGHHPCS